MAEDEKYGHRDDSRKMSFWLKKDLAEKWESFCKEHSLRKTTMIVVAVNDYIRQHTFDTAESAKMAEMASNQAQLVEKMNNVITHLGTINKDKVNVNDGKLKDRILKQLERGPIVDDDLAYIFGMERGDMLDILSVLKSDKIIKQSAKGEWYINDQE